MSLTKELWDAFNEEAEAHRKEIEVRNGRWHFRNKTFEELSIEEQNILDKYVRLEKPSS